LRKEAGIEKIRSQTWGGQLIGQGISLETLNLINFIYLEALRDAERDLRPARGSRLGQLLRKLASEPDQIKIVEHIETANRNIVREPRIQEVEAAVNNRLQDIQGSLFNQKVRISLVSPDFSRIADSLRVLIPLDSVKIRSRITTIDWGDHIASHPLPTDFPTDMIDEKDGFIFVDQSSFEYLEPETRKLLEDHLIGLFDLDRNGMGLNNLIYMGIVLGDLQEQKRMETNTYNALLIEEPEAHLHPQLQDLVYDFLANVSIIENDKPQSPIQVFVSSHSPTLTSRAEIDRVNVVCKGNDRPVNVTSLDMCPLEKVERDDLRRYLDVTKSQLFFARGVIFVEGISEALLVPVFAKRLGKCLEHRLIETVNISGTAFMPFAKLFNSTDSLKRIGFRAAILTDDDRATAEDDPYRIKETMEPGEIASNLVKGKISARAIKAKGLQGGNLAVFTANKTFEYELGMVPENTPVILSALETIHPKKSIKLQDELKCETDNSIRGVRLWLAIKDAKAEFAQRLAAILSDETVPFVIPIYIINAIDHVIAG
jgi:putative ATP-dependent endonuclease of OLD family